VVKKDKTSDDKVVKEEPKAEEPKAEESKAEEPKAEESKAEESKPAPTSDTAQAAGTDQHGRQLYDVKCSKCGKQTQVPFKPSGDRPVYCRDCYMQQRQDRQRY